MIETNLMLGLGILYVLYGIFLYNFGKKTDDVVKFHIASVFLYLPIIVFFVVNNALISIIGGDPVNNFMLALVGIIFVYGFVEMLRNTAGDLKTGWFFIIFILPVLWVVYFIGEMWKK